MRIIWSETGLQVFKIIIKITIVMTGIVCGISSFLVYCCSGAFDNPSSLEEDAKIFKMLYIFLAVAVVNGILCVFSRRINAKIDRQLQRKYNNRQAKMARRRKEIIEASEDYRSFLEDYREAHGDSEEI